MTDIKPSQCGFYVKKTLQTVIAKLYKSTVAVVCESLFYYVMLFFCYNMCEAAGEVSRTNTCERFLTSKTVPKNVGSPSSPNRYKPSRFAVYEPPCYTIEYPHIFGFSLTVNFALCIQTKT